jgi:hypothetical protein
MSQWGLDYADIWSQITLLHQDLGAQVGVTWTPLCLPWMRHKWR